MGKVVCVNGEYKYISDDYNDPNNRFPIGSRDKNYVARMEARNDDYWRSTERWYYYNHQNENCILPTAIGCVVIFLGATPAVSIPMVILTICLVLYICHRNNMALDYDPRAQMYRKRAVEYRMTSKYYSL